mmetsp:Transcript_94866/g.306244  ORF Transcript_94866/g.306244 Transcript_94866/m.306244 type:complete len:283 (+) Transcript_94866:694-1542(+)
MRRDHVPDSALVGWQPRSLRGPSKPHLGYAAHRVPVQSWCRHWEGHLRHLPRRGVPVLRQPFHGRQPLSLRLLTAGCCCLRDPPTSERRGHRWRPAAAGGGGGCFDIGERRGGRGPTTSVAAPRWPAGGVALGRGRGCHRRGAFDAEQQCPRSPQGAGGSSADALARGSLGQGRGGGQGRQRGCRGRREAAGSHPSACAGVLSRWRTRKTHEERGGTKLGEAASARRDLGHEPGTHSSDCGYSPSGRALPRQQQPCRRRGCVRRVRRRERSPAQGADAASDC